MRYTSDSFQYDSEVEEAQHDLYHNREKFFENFKIEAELILEYILSGNFGSAMYELRIRGLEVCEWEIPLVEEEIEYALGLDE